jgi:predicted LPLAT superfamily acyltransferase
VPALDIAFRLEARAIAFSIGEQGRDVATGQFARVDLERGAVAVKSPTHDAAAASWAGQPGTPATCLALRLARWSASAAGRSVSRLFLHLDRLLLFHRQQRAAAPLARLPRARARPQGDLARCLSPLSTPSARTVLDRVYLLREQFDAFAFEASGIRRRSSSRSAAARACSPVGAHLGSFEALRMVGHDKACAWR